LPLALPLLLRVHYHPGGPFLVAETFDRTTVTSDISNTSSLWVDAYRRYYRLWVNLAKTSHASEDDAKDIVHGVIASILSEPSRRFVSLEHLRNYVARAVLNRVILHRQQLNRRSSFTDLPEAMTAVVAEPLLEKPSPESKALRDVIRKLRSKDFEIIKLRFYSGLTFSEISALVGRPISTLKSREDSALNKIRKGLRKKGFR
jgi:RNA polymerase sigma-70 factor (ECF subfamily)